MGLLVVEAALGDGVVDFDPEGDDTCLAFNELFRLLLAVAAEFEVMTGFFC